MRARVVVTGKVKPGQEAAFEAAFVDISRQVKETPGHIRHELLRQVDEVGSYIILSEWESKDAFLAWENLPIHREMMTPIRPFWAAPLVRTIYEVAIDTAK